jgi:hypothetical protein
MNFVVGVTGSIAAYKACELVREFVKAGHDVRVVMTKSACEFVTPLTFRTLSKNPVAVTLFNQEEDNFPNYTKASDTLDFLSSITVNDMNLLVALSNNNLEAKRIVEDTLNGENYLLKDLTENKTLSGNRSQSDAICSRKIVDGHEYELLLYS